MCNIPVVYLDDAGKKTGRRGEIDLPDFNPQVHQLVGKQALVIVHREDFEDKVSQVLKNIIRGRMNLSLGRALNAIDPGPDYPVYLVEVVSGGEHLQFWMPKIACEARPPNSIRKSLGSNTVAAAG